MKALTVGAARGAARLLAESAAPSFAADPINGRGLGAGAPRLGSTET
jgi:hypothetical protein